MALVISATVQSLTLQPIMPTPMGEQPPDPASAPQGMAVLNCGNGTLQVVVANADMGDWVPGTQKTVTIADAGA